MIQASAPGKLFIAGEYGVVEPGGSAILVAVDRYVRVRAVPAATTTVSSAHFGTEPLAWRRGAVALFDPKLPSTEPVNSAPLDSAPLDSAPLDPAPLDPAPLDPVSSALAVVDELAAASGRPEVPLALAIESDLDDVDGAKFGLGSSAAVVVAIVRAVAEAHGLDLDDSAVLRLALIASWRVNPAGSGGDVAASTLGGWISYRSTDAAAVLDRVREFGIAAAIAEDWPGFSAEALPAPSALELVVGWTGSPASTSALVGRSREARQRDDDAYRAFFAESDDAVATLAAAIRADDTAAISSGIRRARAALAGYAALSQVEIETPALTALCAAAEQHGAAAKSSGAGGGDCGIALVGPSVDRGALAADWSAVGIRTLELNVAAPTSGRES